MDLAALHQRAALVTIARDLLAGAVGLVEGLRALLPGLRALDEVTAGRPWVRALLAAEASTDEVPVGAARALWEPTALAALDAAVLAADRPAIEQACRQLIADLVRPQEGALYTAGRCVVCADAGVVVALRARGRGAIIGYCPRCECAWPSLRAAGADAELTVLAAVAPDGVEPPSAADLVATGAELTPLDLAAWGARLPAGV